MAAMADRADLERLLARTALRDHDAFAELYRLTSAKLFGVVLRILPRRSEAEEVLQVAYYRIWSHADRFASARGSPITWMAAIARNAAIDRRRSRASREADRTSSTRDDATGIESVADERPSPEAATIRTDDARRLGRCMDELDERHAFAIRRAFLGGATYREIAGELAVPENTIKTWVRRSLVRLRACMNRDEAAEGEHREGGRP